ncbi:MAG: universal stress protein [Prolixibacteraceae bacterium]
MNYMEHILVSLDLTDMDNFLIRYCSFWAKNFKPKSITFLHVIRSYDIPKEIVSAYPHLNQPLPEILKEEMDEKVNEFFDENNDIEIKTTVREGTTTETIVQYTRKNDISLIIMGKKISYQGRGRIIRKVMSIAPASVLLITETSRPRLDKVLVKMDFSKISSIALKTALHIKENTGTEITCHHAYKLPLKYFPKQPPEQDGNLLKEVKAHTKKEFSKFIKRYKIDLNDITCSSSIDAENEEAEILYTRALTTGADMIVIGTKIKSELADVIVDSTSEKLAESDKNIKVLVVKDRKQTMNFLKALLK